MFSRNIRIVNLCKLSDVVQNKLRFVCKWFASLCFLLSYFWDLFLVLLFRYVSHLRRWLIVIPVVLHLSVLHDIYVLLSLEGLLVWERSLSEFFFNRNVTRISCWLVSWLPWLALVFCFLPWSESSFRLFNFNVEFDESTWRCWDIPHRALDDDRCLFIQDFLQFVEGPRLVLLQVELNFPFGSIYFNSPISPPLWLFFEFCFCHLSDVLIGNGVSERL